MGQRSQIYIRINMKENGVENKKLIANYYQWNYGERMISRARHGIEWINSVIKYSWYFTDKGKLDVLSRIFDVNFDMVDMAVHCNIIKEYEDEVKWCEENNENIPEFNHYVFQWQDNNDGKLLVDIDMENEIVKYAFLDYDANPNNIMDGKAYMDWNMEDWKNSKYLSDEVKSTCTENLQYLSEITLMTKEEVVAFLNDDYEEMPAF